MKECGTMQVLTHNEIAPFFSVWQANAVRIRMPLTMLFVAPFTNNKMLKMPADLQQIFIHFINENSRQTDMVFTVETDGRVGILLTQSTAGEAKAYLQRLTNLYSQHDAFTIFTKQKISFKASIAEIRNDEATFTHILSKSYMALYASESTDQIMYLTDYNKPKIERVKISIIDDEPLMRNILHASIKKLPTAAYEKEIAIFADGEAFLHSEFYYSAHKHIIIMNDVLPKKTGLDVLHEVRKMANERKFIIYMMTNRNNEKDMIDAYEKGVDVYLMKPFNMRLFEAQLQRTFRSLWL